MLRRLSLNRDITSITSSECSCQGFERERDALSAANAQSDNKHEPATNNANGGLKWIQRGGGYYSECSKRLKGQA
jgi:hypothetical protein